MNDARFIIESVQGDAVNGWTYTGTLSVPGGSGSTRHTGIVTADPDSIRWRQEQFELLPGIVGRGYPVHGTQDRLRVLIKEERRTVDCSELAP